MFKRTTTGDDKGRKLVVTTETTGPWPHPYVTRVKLISASGHFVNGFVHATYLSESEAFEGHYAYIDCSYDDTLAIMNQLEKTWTV